MSPTRAAPRPKPGATALLLVETPFQLMCAYEVIQEFGLDHTLVLRMTGVGRNDLQLREAASVLGLAHTEITVRVGRHNADTILALPRLLPPLLRRYDHLFLGSYFSRFIMAVGRVVRAANTWLLDDGMATFLAQDRLAAGGGKPRNLATFFAVSPLQGQTVLRHEFSRLASLNAVTYSDEALFIGQPLVELGLASRSDYRDILAACQSEAAGRMIYVPHRREDPEHVEAIGKDLGVDVVYPSLPVELHFLRKGVVPRRVYTCTSTAAFAFAGRFPRCDVAMLPSLMMNAIPHAPAVLDYARTIANIRIVDMIDSTRNARSAAEKGAASG